jgi:hypothetical protein
VVFVYVLVANLSYSFLLEIDQFVWMLLVMAAVWTAEKPPQVTGGGGLPEALG